MVGRIRRSRQFREILSDLGHGATLHVLAALDNSPALPLLSRNPVARLTISRNLLPKMASGAYYPETQQIEIDSARSSGIHFGAPFVPGETSRMSVATSDKSESLRRTLIHETGHHVQYVGGPAVQDRIDEAWHVRRAITRRADQSVSEYFAETWTAFHVERENLRIYDPHGYAMIEAVASLIAGKGELK